MMKIRVLLFDRDFSWLSARPQVRYEESVGIFGLQFEVKSAANLLKTNEANFLRQRVVFLNLMREDGSVMFLD